MTLDEFKNNVAIKPSNIDAISGYLDEIRAQTVGAKASFKNGDSISLDQGLELITDKIQAQCTRPAVGRVFFVGNGGSAAIASHMANDFMKNGGVLAFTFNDSALLTCISNDFSYEEVFQKPIEMLMTKDDILVAISSSGKSENIQNAVKAASKIGAYTISLSGFLQNNSLRSLADLNLFIDSDAYGVVENGHQILLHFVVDELVRRKEI